MNIYQDLYDEVKDLDTKDEILKCILDKASVRYQAPPYKINSSKFNIKGTSNTIEFDNLIISPDYDINNLFIQILKQSPKIFITNVFLNYYGTNVVGKFVINDKLKTPISKLKTIYNYVMLNDMNYSFNEDYIHISCLSKRFAEIRIGTDYISIYIKFFRIGHINVPINFIEQIKRDAKLKEMMDIFKDL